jgi:predicted lipoprotein with Yx(FWY)xxD motif
MLKPLLSSTLALALSTGLAFAAGHATDPATVTNGIFTDAAGMSLYTFDNDSTGASSCNGGCARNWPPLMADPEAADEGDFTVITRNDGSKQWAYNGDALYTWINDKAPGDMTGDGVGGTWHLARP